MKMVKMLLKIIRIVNYNYDSNENKDGNYLNLNNNEDNDKNFGSYKGDQSIMIFWTILLKILFVKNLNFWHLLAYMLGDRLKKVNMGKLKHFRLRISSKNNQSQTQTYV